MEKSYPIVALPWEDMTERSGGLHWPFGKGNKLPCRPFVDFGILLEDPNVGSVIVSRFDPVYGFESEKTKCLYFPKRYRLADKIVFGSIIIRPGQMKILGPDGKPLLSMDNLPIAGRENDDR